MYVLVVEPDIHQAAAHPVNIYCLYKCGNTDDLFCPREARNATLQNTIAIMSILLQILLLFAQLQARPATVEGVVKNLKTDAPLADVRVTLTPEGGAGVSATTDANGRFVIAAANPGRYGITATRTLFFQPRRAAGATQISLASDERMRDLEIFLMPTAVIAGRILDANRTPLRSVRVEALRLEYRDGNRIFVMAGQNTTDDRGEYRLFNLQPGTYMVRATQGTIASQFAMAYYPGVSDPQYASELKVEAGDEIGAVDLSMQPGTEFFVQFRLGGVPAGNTAMFFVQRRNSKVIETVQTRNETLPDNTYRLTRFNPGSYDIFVRVVQPATPGPPAQPALPTHVGRIPVEISTTNVDLGTVGLQPALRIHGRLVAPELLPVALDPRRIAITFRPINLPASFGGSVRSGATPGNNLADDGSFVITGISIGRYQVSITGLPAGAYLTSLRLGARELADLTLEITEDAGPLELSIGGPASVGALEGSVTNARGDAVPYATVVLVPPPDRRSNPFLFRTATSDQAGLFTIRSILPGDYRLLAWEEVDAGAYQNADFLKNFETRGETVQIQKGNQHSATARVIPAQD